MPQTILGTRSPNGNVGVRGVVDSGELSMLNQGVLSGFDYRISGDIGIDRIAFGGQSGIQDVAVAKNSNGESDLLVGNGQQVIIDGFLQPAIENQSIIYQVVIYKDSTIVTTQNDGVDTVDYMLVASAPSVNPSAPDDSMIRASIPNGFSAFYAIIATVIRTYGGSLAYDSAILNRARLIPTVSVDNYMISPTVDGDVNAGYEYDLNKSITPGNYTFGLNPINAPSAIYNTGNPINCLSVYSTYLRKYATDPIPDDTEYVQRLVSSSGGSGSDLTAREFIRTGFWNENNERVSWYPWIQTGGNLFTNTWSATYSGIVITVFKNGRTADINISGSVTTTIPNGTVLATLPNEFKPYITNTNTTIRLSVSLIGANPISAFNILPNGNIVIDGQLSYGSTTIYIRAGRQYFTAA
jgi:hypothetical protein